MPVPPKLWLRGQPVAFDVEALVAQGNFHRFLDV
jgi:hypothetical protein